MNGEDHGDVAGLNAVDDEICDLEGPAGKLLALDVELSSGGCRDGGGDEGDACGEDIDELHGGSVLLFVVR